MVTTLNVLVILILIVIDGYLIKSLLDSRIIFKKKLEELEDRQISQNRHVNSIRADIDSIMFKIRDIKDSQINSQSINNLTADLDRTIGTIDQIQEKIAEINVTLENVINELNGRS